MRLASPGIGATLVIAVLGFVGFEQSAVYAEEARNPRRTVRVATYFCLALIAVVYAGASWAMAAHSGDGQVVGAARQQGPELLFAMGGSVLAQAGRILFLTSLFAAALAFHNAVWRYMYALGRESVLPRVLGRTGRNSVPKTASAVQSLIGLVFIVVFTVAGWGPLVNLFFWLGTTGGFGILILITLTSIAVIGYFARHRHGESGWRRIVAPGLASVALLAMTVLAVANYSTLLGVAPGAAPAKVLPAAFAVAALVGIGWALVLTAARPEIYAAIGLGADAALTGIPAAPPRPTRPPVGMPPLPSYRAGRQVPDQQPVGQERGFGQQQAYGQERGR